MTCIAGLIHNGRAYVGADSQTTWGYVKHDHTTKVFRVGDAIMAGCGRAALSAAFQHRLAAPDVPEGKEDHWLLVTLPDAMRECVKSIGLWKDGDLSGGGAYIVGWRGRLVAIDCHLAAYPVPAFTSFGSGGEVAIGALEVLGDKGKPRERLNRAIQAACRWSVGVGGEVQIIAEGDTD